MKLDACSSKFVNGGQNANMMVKKCAAWELVNKIMYTACAIALRVEGKLHS